MMLPDNVDWVDWAALVERNCAMNDWDITSALLRCDSIIASQAPSGYCSNRPVSRAMSAGDEPSPALLTRMVGVEKRRVTSAIAARSEERRVGEALGVW